MKRGQRRGPPWRDGGQSGMSAIQHDSEKFSEPTCAHPRIRGTFAFLLRRTPASATEAIRRAAQQNEQRSKKQNNQALDRE